MQMHKCIWSVLCCLMVLHGCSLQPTLGTAFLWGFLLPLSCSPHITSSHHFPQGIPRHTQHMHQSEPNSSSSN